MAVVPEAVQKEIRAVLLSKIGGVPSQRFNRDFKNLLGHPLNWRGLGFSSLLECIRSIPHVVRIDSSSGETKFFGIGDGTSFMTKSQIKAARGLMSPPKGSTEEQQTDPYDGQEPDLNKFEKFLPNLDGLYAICFKKQPHHTESNIRSQFSEVGQVKRVNFSNLYVFVRYANKLHACRAIMKFKEYGITIPVERSSRTQSPAKQTRNFKEKKESPLTSPMPPLHNDLDEMPDLVPDDDSEELAEDPLPAPDDPLSVPEEYKVFIGNVAKEVTQNDLMQLLAGYGAIGVNIITTTFTPFAFAFCTNGQQVANIVQKFHGWTLKGRTLKVAKFVSKQTRMQAATKTGMEHLTQMFNTSATVGYKAQNTTPYTAYNGRRSNGSDLSEVQAVASKSNNRGNSRSGTGQSNSKSAPGRRPPLLPTPSVGVHKDQLNGAMSQESMFWASSNSSNDNTGRPLNKTRVEKEFQRNNMSQRKKTGSTGAPDPAPANNKRNTLSGKDSKKNGSEAKTLPGGKGAAKSKAPKTKTPIPEVSLVEANPLPAVPSQTSTESESGDGGVGVKKKEDTRPRLAGNETKMELRLTNFPFGKTEEELLDLLEPYKVFRVRIKNATKKPTLAFADCHDLVSADRAIADLNGSMYCGRKLNVSYGSQLLRTGAQNAEETKPVSPISQTPSVLPQSAKPVNVSTSVNEPYTPPQPMNIPVVLTSAQSAASITCPPLMKSMIMRMKVSGTMSLAEEFTILVTSVIDKQHFWGHVVECKENLERLMMLMTEISDQCHRIPLTEGQNRCAALYEDEWYRAWVKEYLPNNMFRVFYPDYGNTAIVSSEEMCELPNKYWILPPQAIPFRSSVARDDMPNYEFGTISVKMIKDNLADREPIDVLLL